LTTIVAVRQSDGVIYMGADTCMTSGHRKMTIQEPKMRALNVPGKSGGLMVIGVAGFARGGYEVAHLELPKHSKGLTAVQYLRQKFVPIWRELIEKGGMKATAEGEPERNFNDLLVVYHEQIFIIDQYVCVVEADHDYEAIGSGEDWALGCIYTQLTLGEKMEKAPPIIIKALETAAHFDVGTDGPFDIANCATGEMYPTEVGANIGNPAKAIVVSRDDHSITLQVDGGELKTLAVNGGVATWKHAPDENV